MFKSTLTPTGWLITEIEEEKQPVCHSCPFDRPGSGEIVSNVAATNDKPGMTASEVELSKKVLHTQTEILLVRERVDKLETVFDAVLITRGSTTDKA